MDERESDEWRWREGDGEMGGALGDFKFIILIETLESETFPSQLKCLSVLFKASVRFI